jgi:hypothetical protein
MNSTKTKITGLVVALFFTLTAHTQAATVSAVALNDNTALFTIKYDFLAGKEPFLIPIGASAETKAGSDKNFAGYNITSKAKIVPQVAKTSAITLSSQPIKDGLYYEIPAGERASFTLVVLATMEEGTPSVPYYAELTHLPYFEGSGRTAVTADSISKFKSDEVLLNKEISGPNFILKVK